MRQFLYNMAWSYFGMSVVVAITIIAGNHWTWLSFSVFFGIAIIIGIALTIQREVSARKKADETWERAIQNVNQFRNYIDNKEKK